MSGEEDKGVPRRHAPVPAQIVHSRAAGDASPACGSALKCRLRSHPRQEPGAGKLHAGICAGAVSNHRPNRYKWELRYERT
jgi:hypothetical protein